MLMWSDDGRSELFLGFYVIAWVIAFALTQMLAG